MKKKIAFKILVYSTAIDYVNGDAGLCWALSEALHEYEIKLHNWFYQMNKYFPEIYQYKTGRHRDNNKLWWPRSEIKKRIKILETEIEKLFDKL